MLVVSAARESVVMLSIAMESVLRLSAGVESVAVVSSRRVSASESVRPQSLTALCVSMPNDWTAAIITSSAGTHILAIRFFITRRQRYEKILIIQ